MIGANAHGDAALLAQFRERLEGLIDAGEFLLVLIIVYSRMANFLFIGEVARIDADFLDHTARLPWRHRA